MIHFIIVSYCNWDQISDLCDSALKYNKGEASELLQLHIVDNLGDDVIKLKVAGIPSAKYYHFGNVGYGQGFNNVLNQIQLLKSDLFIISNDDVKLKNLRPVKELIDAHFRLKKDVKNLGILSASYMSSDDFVDSSRYFKLTSNSIEGATQMLFGPGAFWLIGYDFINQVGGFYPGFFLYGEDLELINRGTHYRFKHFLIHNSVVIHDFNYPPEDKYLRILKEKNIISALFLNPQSKVKDPHMFAIKGLAVSLLFGNLARFGRILKGYFGFLLDMSKLKQDKTQLLNNKPFRFLECNYVQNVSKD